MVLGNHRDAWTFGAVDPNSGTAALLEVHLVNNIVFVISYPFIILINCITCSEFIYNNVISYNNHVNNVMPWE